MAAANGAVEGRQWQTVGQGGGHDQAIGWVAVEIGGQGVQSDHHLAVERQHRDHVRGRCLAQPVFEGPIQLQAPLRLQHLRFPQADRRQPQLAGLGCLIDGPPLPGCQLGCTEQPPQPEVGVEQNVHCRASKSPACSTDSSEDASKEPVPRSCSQGLASCPAGPGAGDRRATALPRRRMVIGSPPASICRISSRHWARKAVTEMSVF